MFHVLGLILKTSHYRSAQTADSLDKLEQGWASFELSLQRLQETANQRHILNSLRFEMMDDRYQKISDAEQKTFKWIFEDSEKQTSSNPNLRLAFKEWLATGDGIFHISGKPGSGKSTLMKYLCRHPETETQLQRWAGERQLVLTRFFFWRPGNDPLQKSLLGLIRSLLFHILCKTPEKISDFFPQHWDPSSYGLWAHPSTIQLQNEEILDALDLLIDSKYIYDNHRFCFFIDGLDEFEENDLTYGHLIKQLKAWSTSLSGSIKLCVSSRELPEFEHLSDNQRLRLQDLTSEDIRTFVDQRLNNWDEFQKLREDHAEDCAKLLKEVVSKADGVFLWVSLTMKLLAEGAVSGDTPYRLIHKLSRFPQRLEHFFGHILKSIPKSDREWAYCALLLTNTKHEAHNGHTSFDIYSPYSEIPDATSQLFRTESLFRYSFLDDYLDDRNFAKRREYQSLTVSQIDGRLDTATAQVTGRCKGLIELRQASNFPRTVRGNYDVAFTHRSIPEFLTEALKKEEFQRYTQNFDVLDAELQSLLATVKALSLFGESNNSVLYWNAIEDLVSRIRDVETSHRELYFISMDVLENALRQKQLELWPEFEETRWSKFTSVPWALHIYDPLFISITHLAASICFHEYLTWKIQSGHRQTKGIDSIELLRAVVLGSNDILQDVDMERVAKTLRDLFIIESSGRTFGLTSPNEKDLGKSLWWLLLSNIDDLAIWRPGFWKKVEVFLECGADPPQWRLIPRCDKFIFKDGSFYKDESFSEEESFREEESFSAGELAYINGSGDECYRATLIIGEQQHDIDSPSSELRRLLMQHGKRVTLREYLDKHEPDNAGVIREFLDERATPPQSSPSAIEDEIPLPELDEVEAKSDEDILMRPERVLISGPMITKSPGRDSWDCVRDFLFRTIKTPMLPWALFGELAHCLDMT